MPFEFKPFREMPDVVLVEPKAFGDERGWFMETFKESDMAKHGIVGPFRQDNHSRSVGRGILRGLHYQKDPAAQGKLVRCLAGEILDVAVDIRKGSPTFGRHVTAHLSATNRAMIWVPPGFAHGVLTLTDVAEIAYKVTHEYSPAHDRGIRWNDPALGIAWPHEHPILSKKDAEAPLLQDADNDFTWKGP
ncbi:MAG: dTDP-4-dehydrorhamnose 3,5-epimerase [Thermoplasmata archaeon]|jgi:dTDP-4-dehydrorhamnose 3,5-epimerase|nr:dTDP-4-dehydrorhamnose 3,5-epimerase [Thermoplasmata archaeon]